MPPPRRGELRVGVVGGVAGAAEDRAVDAKVVAGGEGHTGSRPHVAKDVVAVRAVGLAQGELGAGDVGVAGLVPGQRRPEIPGAHRRGRAGLVASHGGSSDSGLRANALRHFRLPDGRVGKKRLCEERGCSRRGGLETGIAGWCGRRTFVYV